MEKVSFITTNAEETQKVGEILASELQGGEILSLIGDLGGGKTTFTQGVARGLGIKDRVISPTFIIFKKFALKSKKHKWLYHFDLYRLSDLQELVDLDFEDIISSPENITVLEWAQKAKEIIPPSKNIRVEFKYLGKGKRQITVSSSK